jgi:ribonuclease P protein component
VQAVSVLPGSGSARFSLARHRLRQADFARVYRLGRRAQGQSLTVILLENGRPHLRLGLSVSKKHAREAVDRNRSRRILREAFRLSRAELPAGFDVVLVAATGGTRLDLASTRAELVELCERALKKKPRVRADPPAP